MAVIPNQHVAFRPNSRLFPKQVPYCWAVNEMDRGGIGILNIVYYGFTANWKLAVFY
jgi:hypothetical protein